MRRYNWILLIALAGFAAACARTVDVEKEREALLAADRAWSDSTTDAEKFHSFVGADASVYPPEMSLVSGPESIRDFFAQISSAPGFALKWTPDKAVVGASGDVGYTTGSYEMTAEDTTEHGKYVTVWKKQSDGSWKVAEDIFNANEAAKPAPSQHALVAASALTWGDPPPALPPGAKFAVVSGDPSKAGPFVVRVQFPRGYRVLAHGHPTDENVTVISGTVSLGMGEKFDEAAMEDVATGGYALLPAKMPHFAMAKTAATFQIHGMGPFVLDYVNPADDPRNQAK